MPQDPSTTGRLLKYIHTPRRGFVGLVMHIKLVIPVSVTPEGGELSLGIFRDRWQTFAQWLPSDRLTFPGSPPPSPQSVCRVAATVHKYARDRLTELGIVELRGLESSDTRRGRRLN